MTAAQKAHEPSQVLPTESQLLDVLYEVLAQGVPPKGTLTSEDVERFLHEHARNKKPVTEMLEFFQKYALPTDAGDYGADPALGELASGLHKERGPISATFNLDDNGEPQARSASESGPVRKIEPMPEVNTSPRARIVELVPQQRRGSWTMAAVSLASVLVLGGALFATYRHAQDLSAQLSQARMQQRTTDAALTTLEQRAEQLKSNLERSEGDRQSLATRFDDFIVGEAQKRSAEETALERLLGKRFETLRDRALQEAMLKPAAQP
jgi:hypothetical protein